jgi:hypothetical protein
MDFLEECRIRFTRVQKRVQETQAAMQAATAQYQAAMQQLNGLQILINAEIGERQRTGTMVVTVVTAPAAVPVPAVVPKPTPVAAVEVPPTPTTEINKTDMIRDLLREHPLGMTATEIWSEVKDRMNHRAYLYSVLSRLKDRDEVCLRRKKYILKIVPKAVEDKEAAVVH